MDVDQYQMGRSKIFIKNPESVTIYEDRIYNATTRNCDISGWFFLERGFPAAGAEPYLTSRHQKKPKIENVWQTHVNAIVTKAAVSEFCFRDPRICGFLRLCVRDAMLARYLHL